MVIAWAGHVTCRDKLAQKTIYKVWVRRYACVHEARLECCRPHIWRRDLRQNIGEQLGVFIGEQLGAFRRKRGRGLRFLETITGRAPLLRGRLIFQCLDWFRAHGNHSTNRWCPD